MLGQVRGRFWNHKVKKSYRFKEKDLKEDNRCLIGLKSRMTKTPFPLLYTLKEAKKDQRIETT
jgi:hypothetical protein